MIEFRIERVAWSDPRAVALRAAMDEEMGERYGPWRDDDPVQETVRAALSVDPADLVTTVLAVDADGVAQGHIALRRLGTEWEAKRLVVLPGARRSGVARALLSRVVDDAFEAGAPRVVLQTGRLQPEAAALYVREGWMPIPVYEPYAAVMPDSLTFELLADVRPA